MKKILTIIGVIALLLLVLIGVAGFWAYNKFLYTEPLSEQELAELQVDWDNATGGNWSPWWDRGDGTIEWNPTASFNEWVASLSDEDKAWPLLIDAQFTYRDYLMSPIMLDYLGTIPSDPLWWEKLSPELEGEQADALFTAAMKWCDKPVLGAVLSDGTDPLEHAYLVDLAAEIDAGSTHVTYDGPGPLNFDPDADIPLSKLHTPWLGYLRQATNFLRSKGAYELEQGNTEGFVAAMEGILCGSELSMTVPNILGSLVEVAIERVALETISWGVTTHHEQFDERMLTRLSDAVRDYANARIVWEGEAMLFRDTIRRLSDQDGRFGGVTQGGTGTLGKASSLSDTELHASSQRAFLVSNAVMRDVELMSEIPWDTSVSAYERFLTESVSLNPAAQMMLDILYPGVGKAAIVVREVKQRTIGTEVGLAAYLHQERHGEFPSSIEDIDPDLLAGISPIDVFTSERLKYVLTNEGPVVYSVGDDRVDNGGTQGWVESSRAGESGRLVKASVQWLSLEQAQNLSDNPDAQWDWVLFPVPIDDPTPLEDDDFDPDWDLKQSGMYDEEPDTENNPDDEG